MSDAPYIGRLEDVSLPEIFRRCYLSSSSGTLDLQSGQDQRRIVFQSGEVRSARSNRMEQRIGTFLVRRGVIDQQTLDMALRERRPGAPLGAAIREAAGLEGARVEEHLKELVGEIVFECFGWYSGMYRFDPAQPALRDEIVIRVSTADLIFTGFRRHATGAMVDTLLGDGSGIPVPNPNLMLLFQHLTLKPEEMHLLGRIDGATSIDMLLKLIPGDRNANRRILGGLMACGLITIQGTTGNVDMKAYFERYASTASPPASGQAGASRPSRRTKKRKSVKWVRPKRPEIIYTEKDITIMRQKILDKHKNLGSMNYYQLLECPVKATQKEIHFAFLNLGTFYHPDLALKEPFKDLRPQLVDIFQKMEEAYSILVTHEKRIEYDRRMGRY